MYKVLIIGNAESVWLKEFIKEIHIKAGHVVHVLSFDQISLANQLEYNDLNVNVIEAKSEKKFISKFQKAILLLKVLAEETYRNFDCLEIQSPPHSVQAYMLNMAIKVLNLKTITIFWGSDILEINQKSADKMKRLLDNSDQIVLGTEMMLDRFELFFGLRYQMRISDAKFGSLAFKEIELLKKEYSKEQCKEKMGFDPDKLVVAIGHSGDRRHQHIKALESLQRLEKLYKKHMKLVLHVSGIEKVYLKEVKSEADQTGIEYVIIDRFLDLSEIAKLRMSTDVFVHTQIADALSGTIRECIFSEAVLINPTWIKYSEFDEMGIQYIEYESFDVLDKCLKEYLDNRAKIDVVENSMNIYNKYSWEAVRTEWEKVFN